MLGIAIINYNNFEKTKECLESIFKTVKSEYKIYLTDNGSADGSYEKLATMLKNEERVCLIRSEENLGFARGNNLCISYAQRDGCDYVLFSNNDIIFKENAVDGLLKDLKQTNAFIVAPKILSIDGKWQASVKAVKPSFREYLLFSNYIFGSFVSKKRQRAFFKKMLPKSFSEVYWVSGACFMANLAQFKSIGYFDAYTFLYFEEYIISEKATRKKLKIFYNPAYEVIHYHGASSGNGANLFTRTENFRSECYMFSNYWVIRKAELKLLRHIRCLEVLYTFTKEKQLRNALHFVFESRKIIKETPRKK